MSPIHLTIYHENSQVYSKHCPKSGSVTISSKKLKFSETDQEITSLRFEFQKIDKILKISFLILQTQGTSSMDKTNSEPKPKKETLKVKSKSQKVALNESQTKKNSESNFLEFETEKFEKNFKSQQARLKEFVSPQWEKYENNENSFEHTRQSNSYDELLKEFIVCCVISENELKNNVVKLVEAAGGCYIQEILDICNLIICDDVSYDFFKERIETAQVVRIQ